MKCKVPGCGLEEHGMLPCGRAKRMAAGVNTERMSNNADEKSNELDKPAKFDKVAYQREYMRKSRAKKRGGE